MGGGRQSPGGELVGDDVLILQHVWRRWTKATRAAADAGPRLAVPEAFPLKGPAGPVGGGQVWVHEVRALEETGFRVDETAGPATHDGWARAEPGRPANLTWRLGKGEAELGLLRPSATLQTKWPAHLPTPICVVGPDDVVRIDWNGRFLRSISGLNRSTYYEWHTYWLTWAEDPPRDVFTAAVPRKHVDLRTRIY